MEPIKEFTVGLVIVCVLGAIIIILSPEGSFEKHVKTSVSLVMLLCFVYPFCSGAELDVDFDLQPADSDIVMSAEELFVDSFRSKLVSDIKNLLSENGIEVSKIEIDMHTSEEKEILIEKVTIYLLSDYATQFEYIQKMIKDKFGIESRTEVCYESEIQ